MSVTKIESCKARSFITLCGAYAGFVIAFLDYLLLARDIAAANPLVGAVAGSTKLSSKSSGGTGATFTFSAFAAIVEARLLECTGAD
jgi:hypothetical protein